MKTIQLSHGKAAFIDDEDYDLVTMYKWRAIETNPNRVYAYAYLGGRDSREYLHRFIMKLRVGDRFSVDHINGHTLDCRKANMRICKQGENARNQKTQSRPKSSIYKGVGWHKVHSAWRAYCKINKKSIHIGRFNTQVEAAAAYDLKALNIFGEFAKPNFACSRILHKAIQLEKNN